MGNRWTTHIVYLDTDASVAEKAEAVLGEFEKRGYVVVRCPPHEKVEGESDTDSMVRRLVNTHERVTVALVTHVGKWPLFVQGSCRLVEATTSNTTARTLREALCKHDGYTELYTTILAHKPDDPEVYADILRYSVVAGLTPDTPAPVIATDILRKARA